jgi:hypothetical protein
MCFLCIHFHFKYNLINLKVKLIIRKIINLGYLSLSLMLRPTVSRPVYLGVKHPFGAYDQIFITCVTVTVLFLWGALSDERSGLSLYMLLVLASAVFLGFESLGT